MSAPATASSRQRLWPRAIVRNVVEQHAEDAATLHGTRTILSAAAHVKLHQLGRFDERLQLHLEGLRIAGKPGLAICNSALEMATPGTMFVASALALSERQSQWLDRLFLLAEAVPESQRGLLAAFGWVDPAPVRAIVADLNGLAGEPLRRLAAICGQSIHGSEMSAFVRQATGDPVPTVRARAWRAAGELGDHSQQPPSVSAMNDADYECRFWIAWAAVLLGDRRRGLEALRGLAMNAGAFRARAFQLALQASEVDAAHALLKSLAEQPAQLRWLVRGAGLIGDPRYIPWLISLMSDDRLARLAGESFSRITGLDLAWLDLDRKPPEGMQTGPNDNPDDEDVAMDEDNGLPWPDPERVQAWWTVNSHCFQLGTRYFMGSQPSSAHCLQVLKDGYQRQREAAAIWRCILQPGTPLFPVRAPAWRQERWLAQMH